ncbi:MAG TPA: class I SAM-dependent methyltransferase [Candidatus Binatia bacterium]|nr:class I SAM-dependent methyltransferase [Candidatus Binatia bacterium]
MPPRQTSPAPDWLKALAESTSGFAEAIELEQIGFDSWRCMPPDVYVDKDVLDLGCGVGAASALFAQRGARSVLGIDPELTEEHAARLSAIPRSAFERGTLSAQIVDGRKFDFVYARVVTEHIYDLPSALRLVFDLLRPGGRFVGLHDNFYGPMGAHDQGLFGTAPDDDHRIDSKAVPCWTSPSKCEASRDFREHYEKNFDWHARNWTLTPEDCTRCPYYRRSRFWAHLLCQDDYPTLFDGDFFQTLRDGGVNKVTPFQLRQFLVESGLRILTWEPERLKNVPPEELSMRFAIDDLQTGPILFAAERPADAS